MPDAPSRKEKLAIEEQKREAMRSLAKSEAARVEFAESRAALLEDRIDQVSSIRNIFSPINIGTGNPVFDVPFDDVDVVYMIPQVGAFPTAQFEGSQLTVGTFEIGGGVEFHIKMARDGRIDVAEGATRMLLNKFVAQEEGIGWAMVQYHAGQVASDQVFTAFKDDGTAGGSGAGKMNMYTLNELLTMGDLVGRGGRRVTDLYLHARRFGDLRTGVFMEALPEAIRLQLFNSGKGATDLNGLRIHKVYDADLVDEDTGYAFTRRDGVTYGVMPIRRGIETRLDPIAMRERKIGVFGDSELGFGILDSKGLIVVNF